MEKMVRPFQNLVEKILTFCLDRMQQQQQQGDPVNEIDQLERRAAVSRTAQMKRFDNLLPQEFSDLAPEQKYAERIILPFTHSFTHFFIPLP